MPVRIMTNFMVAAVAAVVAGGFAQGPAHADPNAGKTIALQWCASCHLVSDDQPVADSASVPSFLDISKDADWNEASLATFLANPHPKMPDMNLTTREIANIAEYIDSLAP